MSNPTRSRAEHPLCIAPDVCSYPSARCVEPSRCPAPAADRAQITPDRAATDAQVHTAWKVLREWGYPVSPIAIKAALEAVKRDG